MNSIKQAQRQSRIRLLLLLGCVGGTMAAARGGEESADRKLFLTTCAPCHGPDGRAHTPAARKLGAKDLTERKLSDAEIRQQIIEGRRDKAGKSLMPAFGGKLTEAQITALVTEVKALRK